MKEKYLEAFMNVFQCEAAAAKEMEYLESEGWDSVAHMMLVSELEDVFDIMFDTDDILAFSSFEKGVEILEKMGVELNA